MMSNCHRELILPVWFEVAPSETRRDLAYCDQRFFLGGFDTMPSAVA